MRASGITATAPSYSYNTDTASHVEASPRKPGMGGIGARLAWYEQTGGRIYICEVIPNAPASDSGQVLVGDVLISVDGQRVQGSRLEDVNRLIAGPEGTPVNLELQHEDGNIARVTLLRRPIYGPGDRSSRSSY